ncbi:1-deoxy-D-xylulose-5-phosphate synthase [Glutamicibacter protophormiae]|uniref:1-deoxy-D-xylulose-5-phosphate synthase n=1 Tax=Glutamicibacter protophormiae TaxID=37930 RepID=A0ABS4XUN0_GLUPR|nr:1-deoxy-D-xylulose-5-phosphate synthase [Glutamicibacter protophormiae]MBP2400040.1 1-deoxy-D-xylulose-5-phosphate synthase [Glutamicibacter protophormiae]QRQ77372.1 1-deoxy-D-xylulose-5-phosphate synthase [Glutamicibacter protophormiae]WPR63353.1 1-deoxy-D-xylulose-5-phosphate synthase [Glutamicibacter protophormiae]WPR66849.1 1-deoxy-D-xylulose-5-phosphate synthase [Glutamicibacter protophormiae]GGL75737.1 1-deoxy-D-xylulose-5-phosphate synthase 2 [Glutamicibacter protophormiae]
MSLLETIKKPSDLRALTLDQLTQLAQEIRAFLIDNVARTGGHLGPNLGVVELTIAMHRVFDSPTDSIVFDTGHQSYVHKLLTGRQNFQTLRQQGGLSGYPDRGESEHDIVESSHASSSLSWIDGISRANKLTGRTESYAVGLVGDGALTGGMVWEAVNNIAADKERKAVIVVNDNGRSYAPTIGGLADQLAGLRQQLDKVRTHPAYETAMDKLKGRLKDSGPVGNFTYKSLHATKKGIKDWWAPQGLFEDLGLKYIGPIDGHNLAAVEEALQQAKQYGGPVLVHALTEKGHGYAPALADEADQFHAVGVIDPATGAPVAKPSAQSWTSVFGDEIAKIADEREDVVAITGAMLLPVGLKKMSDAHPDRVLDVGIAEQHAMTTAAGLAFGGLHPVVCVYATFLNRAFDQLLMDVALHKAGVTIVLDRAGVTGPDGASHHGMWDMALTQIIPNLHLAAPRDATRLREELREAMDINDAPSVVRFSKGSVGEEVEAIDRLPDGVDVLARLGDRAAPDVLIISVGAMSELSLDVAARLNSQGVSVTVVDPRWVLPMPSSVISLAARHRIVVCIEDGVRAGGVGSRLRTEMRAAGVDTALNEVGLPTKFLAHGTRAEVLERVGLTAQQVARDTLAQVLGTKVPFARPLPGQDLPTGQIPKL